MDNQQLITYRKLIFLAKNAKFGDGYFWIHPNCNNYKIIYTSTTPELLAIKMRILPEIFPSGINLIKNRKGCFPNAKPLYSLTSLVHPIFTKYALMNKYKIFNELTIKDFGLWFLDDGCLIKRKEYKNRIYYRVLLCIGNTCKTKILEILFKKTLKNLFGNKFGRITLNNSKATEKNKNWIIPLPIAQLILNESIKYGILLNKFPMVQVQRLSPCESRESGLRFPKRHPLNNYIG